MANVIFGGGVADMRGSTGGTTYSRGKGGSVQRARVKPTNPQSTFQMDQRSIMTELSQAWSQTLTQEQRDGWSAFGVSFPSTNKLGQAIQLSGIQAFSKIGARLVAAGSPYLADAPADQNVGELQTLTLSGDIGAGDFELGFTSVGTISGDRLVIRMTPSISPGISNVGNKLRFVAATAVNPSSPVDLTSLFASRFGGPPLVGKKLVCRASFLRVANGAASSELEAYAIVSETA